MTMIHRKVPKENQLFCMLIKTQNQKPNSIIDFIPNQLLCISSFPQIQHIENYHKIDSDEISNINSTLFDDISSIKILCFTFHFLSHRKYTKLVLF